MYTLFKVDLSPGNENTQSVIGIIAMNDKLSLNEKKELMDKIKVPNDMANDISNFA